MGQFYMQIPTSGGSVFSAKQHPVHWGLYIFGLGEIIMRHELQLDNSIYSLEAVQKAAYRFIDRFAMVVSNKENSAGWKMIIVLIDG